MPGIAEAVDATVSGHRTDGGDSDKPPFGRLVNVTKTFDTGSQSVLAVKDVSLQFRKGDLISLIGPSGCGKTTVLKMMGGLISASSGAAGAGRQGRSPARSRASASCSRRRR